MQQGFDLLPGAEMFRVLGRIAAVIALGGGLLGVTPALATDLDVDYGPVPVPVPPPPPMVSTTYDYMLHGVLTKRIPVRAAPMRWSRVIVWLPTGTIPALTGRCTRNLELGSIAEKPSWYRGLVVGQRWCEVSSNNVAGWVDGSFMKAF